MHGRRPLEVQGGIQDGANQTCPDFGYCLKTSRRRASTGLASKGREKRGTGLPTQAVLGTETRTENPELAFSNIKQCYNSK